MEKTIMKFLFVITLNLVCINAIAEEVFWLTHIAAPYDVDYKGNPLPEREPPIEYPDSIRSAGPDTITFKEGKFF